ncbi:hypothetical protein [Mesorhizobium sp. M0323]|uniref:hypothetical protein n=1 Tax=Mesorhizobium sp. M0323 TaxID=2956938 RepID=UPI003336DFD2
MVERNAEQCFPAGVENERTIKTNRPITVPHAAGHSRQILLWSGNIGRRIQTFDPPVAPNGKGAKQSFFGESQTLHASHVVRRRGRGAFLLAGVLVGKSVCKE